MKKLISAFATLCLLAVSCQGDDETINTKEPTLGVGITIQSAGGLQITFQEMTEDSRCPSNVTCIWRGRAVASFKVAKNNGESVSISLTDYERPTLEPKESAAVFGHTIRLLEVTPWPESPNVIQPGDYSVKIRVD